jgi:phenylalanyl-tRNA synthetase alpha chain
MSEIKIDLTEQNQLLEALNSRTDAEATREKRYLSMPDLSRTEGSPLHAIVEHVKQTPVLKDFDNIVIPEIVPASVSFDLFNFAPDHVARSKSDTYYVDDKNILRTHDTVMWYYYLQNPTIVEKIKNQESFGVICYGKVYRKDEIDRHHMNVFHQMGGLYMVPKSVKTLELDDLKAALVEIAQSIFGQNVVYRFNVDTFPYTDPSLEMEVQINDKWIEVLGGGMPRMEVLKNFNVEGYNGWAFGFGLERLAIISMELPDIRLLWSDDERVKKQLVLGQKFVEVSKFPPIVRDISFIVDKNFVLNDYFDLIRDIGGDIVEQVELLDKYENAEKFGEGKTSYTFRATFRSRERTLTTEEIEPIMEKLYNQTKEIYQAQVR